MPAGTLAVTGSTGRVGGGVARRLADAGIAQRLIVRDPSRAPELDGTEVVVAEYGDLDASRNALHGVDVVFMVSGSEDPDRVDQHRTFIDAAADVGVHQVVYLSFYGAAPDATFTLARDHYETEQHLRRSGLEWTFVRDNLYLDFFVHMVGEDGVIRGPAGGGRVAAVAIDDIADVAAAVLQEPSPHVGHTYSLTGPEALTLEEVAETIHRLTGRPVSYHDETREEALASRAGYDDVPDWLVEAWISTYTAIREGELAGVTDDVERLSGHPPRSLADVVEALG